MGHEWLEKLAEILEAAGIRAGEDYPSGPMPRIGSPVAALGIRELDSGAGTVTFSLRILSPRNLGGWSCQSAAVQAAAALTAAGISCRSGEMKYLSGSDCFCVEITAVMAVYPLDGGWAAGEGWQYLCNDTQLLGVESFTARQDLGRRIVGATYQSEPVGISPGSGGWNLTLIQRLGRAEAEPAQPEEPFTLTVTGGSGSTVYSGCCWNETEYRNTHQGLVTERRGFALSREVTENG